uniref:Peptidylprolyl isomerase putative n=1 Tax=Albugo laibachii Nc14 TaxID=890382 RepID=F0W6W1_9STRA|nr:peptidylprolyl isomerase putative [Albugo laibachii Nc14]|eukprot:CCA16856.1 peptidylprolyl isomerase putative [Albugo laibachii Nc14]
MGKKQHSKDRLFITQTEHKYLYGGKKSEQRRAYKRLPFDHCAITLRPFQTPVCTREGHLFDLEAIVPYLQSHETNPVTGEPLTLKDLIRLKFYKNDKGDYFCPVTYKVFTDHTKITAIAVSGNVYSQDAIHELNLKPKNWTDLLTGEPFKRKDIIVLQDPQNFTNREIVNFKHLRQSAQAQSMLLAQSDVAPGLKNINTNSATDRIFQELEAKRIEKQNLDIKLKQQSEKPMGEVVQTRSPQEPSQSSIDMPTSKAEDKPKSEMLHYSKFTTGTVSRSFTSSTLTPVTENKPAQLSSQERLDLRWHAVRRMKEKGFVRLETNFGDINMEIHCDYVPRTADNFMSLCEAKYYDGVLFHRVIPGFIMQGGDPSGTGTGGDSIWKKPFSNEIDSRLSHDSRGIISMANSGPDTNRSQFFITFRPCPHLDKKHSVFGNVVGGVATLDRIEKVVTQPGEHRPMEDVRIKRAHVFANPFRTYEEAVTNGREAVVDARERRLNAGKEKKLAASVVKLGEDWVAVDSDVAGEDFEHILSKQAQQDIQARQSSCPDQMVGKYLSAKLADSKNKHSQADLCPAKAPPIIEQKGKKRKANGSGGFGNFSGW